MPAEINYVVKTSSNTVSVSGSRLSALFAESGSCFTGFQKSDLNKMEISVQASKYYKEQKDGDALNVLQGESYTVTVLDESAVVVQSRNKNGRLELTIGELDSLGNVRSVPAWLERCKISVPSPGEGFNFLPTNVNFSFGAGTLLGGGTPTPTPGQNVG